MKGFSDWCALGISIALCVATAAIGFWISRPALLLWYPSLNKPAWTPPDAIFAPVWTALYLTMALAAWLVWLRRPSGDVATALGFFAVQLVLNAAWSGLFFGLHSPAAGLADIVLLWCAIVATALSFGRISVLAGWLLAPYLAWVSFAAILNFAVWQLN
jgi:benzodiazapine receptor